MRELISFLLIAILFGIHPVLSQNSKQLQKHEDTRNRIVNNGEIDLINKALFDKNIDNFKAYYQNYLTGFSDINFDVKEILETEEKIVKHWNFIGKHTGDFFGIPPTGKSVDIERVTLVKMKNGKVTQEQDFMDNTMFLQQLGVVSDPNNLTIINNLYESFAKGDIPSVLGALDAKVVWNEAEGNSLADGNPYIGPDAVLNGVFARIGARHDYFKTTNVQLHEMSNNQVLATLRYEAKLKKNGALLDAQAAHLWTLNNGKVIVFQQYADTRQLAETEAASDVPMIMSHNFYLPVSTQSAIAKAAYYKATYFASNIRFKEANAELDKALQEDPNFLMAYALKSFYADDENKAKIIDKALAIDTKDFNEAEKIVRQLLVIWDKDLQASTADNMQSLVAAYPKAPQAYHWAALHAAYTDKNQEAAKQYALKLVKMSPNFGPNYNTLGYLYMGNNEMDKAKMAFEKYIAYSSTDANAYDSMGEYYMNNKQYTKSAEYYTKAATMGITSAAVKAEKAKAMVTPSEKGQDK